MPIGRPTPTSNERGRKACAGDVRRQKAAVLFALFFAGQACSGLHLAVEEHATCEHGDVVHASSVGPQTLEDSSVANSPLANATLQPRKLPTAIEDEHDHCDVLARSQQMLVSSDRLAASPGTAAVIFSTTTEPNVETMVAKALYRLAPKQSPPLV